MSFFRELDRFVGSKTFLRCISVCIAFFLWVYVNGDLGADTEKEMSCDVEFRSISSELTLDVDQRTVDVGIQGPRDVVAGLTPQNVLCEVDVRGLGPGKYRLPVKVNLPGKSTLTRLKPLNLEVTLIRYAEKVLPVHVSVVNGLPPGLLMDSVELDPKDVTIRGPEDVISEVTDVLVQPTLEELQRGETRDLPLKLVHPEGVDASLTVYPETVDLTAILRKGQPRAVIPVEVPISGVPDVNFQVDRLVVSPSFVEVEGPEKALQSLRQLETEAIDISGFDQDRSMIVPLRPLADKDLHILGETSISVKVMLKPKISSRLFSRVPVEIRGRSVYPGWEVLPQAVDVRIQGSVAAVSAIEDDPPFSVYVDVTNIVSRQLRVPVTIDVNTRDLSIVSVEPERVTVKAKVQ